MFYDLGMLSLLKSQLETGTDAQTALSNLPCEVRLIYKNKDDSAFPHVVFKGANAGFKRTNVVDTIDVYLYTEDQSILLYHNQRSNRNEDTDMVEVKLSDTEFNALVTFCR